MPKHKKKTIREGIIAVMKLTIIANLIRGLRTNAEVQGEESEMNENKDRSLTWKDYLCVLLFAFIVCLVYTLLEFSG